MTTRDTSPALIENSDGFGGSSRPVNSGVGLLMKIHMMSRLLMICLLVSPSAPSAAVSQSTTASRTYRMGTVGHLEMTVPSEWQEVSKTLEGPQGVTLAYRLPPRTDFYMKVTAVWIPPEGRKSRGPDWVRRALEKAARGIVGPSKTLPTLTPISSPGGSGYYFQSSVYNRLPVGEFTYATAGVLELGEVTFVFTTYSNTKDLPEIRDSLRVVESAHFVAGKK